MQNVDLPPESASSYRANSKVGLNFESPCSAARLLAVLPLLSSLSKINYFVTTNISVKTGIKRMFAKFVNSLTGDEQG